MNRQEPDVVAGLNIGVAGCEHAAEIGRGGFGVVYRAWQPAFSRTVAVKILAADRLDERSRVRFERELKAMGRLSGHPHIVTVHQAGHTDSGNPYILMAYEEGGSLADRILADRILADRQPADRTGAEVSGAPWAEAVAGGIVVAGALETAHRAGVLHRDVKPENILISRYGELKLADFGLAHPLRHAGLHQAHSVTASVLHAAPEILRGEAASVASDVYALASTVFTWLSGEAAFAPAAGEPVSDVIARIARNPLPDLRPGGVPDAVCAVLERGMAKKPAARQPTAARFAEELQQAQLTSGRPVTELILGGAAALAWLDDAPAPHRTATGPGMSLSARMRAALHLSATAEHTPPRGAPHSSATASPRRRTAARLATAAVVVAAALTCGGSQPVQGPIPIEMSSTVDFGDQVLSAEAQERPVTLRHRGTRPVRVARVALAGDDFRVTTDRCTGRTLQRDSGCEVIVAFTPRAAGLRRAGLSLTLAGRDDVRTVAVAGTGLLSYATDDNPPPGPCYADAYQVGQSAYGYVGGLQAISVKQYWSPGCRASMAYAWVWKQYRDNAGVRGKWTVQLAVVGQPGTRTRARATGQPLELWTEPLTGFAGCTRATATFVGTGVTAPVTVTTPDHCA